MTYLQRSSIKNKNRKNLIFAISLVIGFLFLVFVLKNPLSNVIHYTVGPVNQAKQILLKPFDNLFTYFKSKKELQKVNDELVEENKKLKFDNLATASLRDENSELKKILKFDTNESEFVLGEVILTPPFSPFDTFVVRIPDNFIQEEDLIKERVSVNDLVFVDGIIAGKVIEVFNKTAKVKLFSSYQEFLPIKINNEILTQAQGLGGLSFKVELPKDMDVAEGDIVYASQYSDNPIGLVGKIEINESSTFQIVYFNYLFGYVDFDFVQIFKPEI